jgi:hypothetical protein
MLYNICLKLTDFEKSTIITEIFIKSAPRDLGFDSLWGPGIFLFTTASRSALEPTQPPIQWAPRAISLGVKRPEREAGHSPTSSFEAKNMWSYTSTPTIQLHGAVLS